MEESRTPAQTSDIASQLTITETQARTMVAALSHRSMCDLAVRHIFKSPLPRQIRTILEFMPVIRVQYGLVATNKLSDILRAEFGIDIRQSHRWIQRAVDGGWIVPKEYPADRRCTDNQYNPCRGIPETLRRLTELYILIGVVVEAQLRAPLDTTAGSNLVPPEVYMHPVTIVRAKHAASLLRDPGSLR